MSVIQLDYVTVYTFRNETIRSAVSLFFFMTKKTKASAVAFTDMFVVTNCAVNELAKRNRSRLNDRATISLCAIYSRSIGQMFQLRPFRVITSEAFTVAFSRRKGEMFTVKYVAYWWWSLAHLPSYWHRRRRSWVRPGEHVRRQHSTHNCSRSVHLTVWYVCILTASVA